MWDRLIATTGGRVATLLRLALGLVMLPHGAQKLLGWFGGPGVAGTIGHFRHDFSIPAVVTLLVIAAEFFGALALITGFMTRFSAASIAMVMLGAVYFDHWHVGFFMNWFGQQAGEGFEYHILAIAQALALVVLGGGWLSIDALLHRRRAAAVYASGAQAAHSARRDPAGARSAPFASSA